MCIVLSRIPLLRDTHSAMEEWNQRENEMNQEDGDDDFDDLSEEVEEEGDDDDDGAMMMERMERMTMRRRLK
jgi:hypothetical protein